MRWHPSPLACRAVRDRALEVRLHGLVGDLRPACWSSVNGPCQLNEAHIPAGSAIPPEPQGPSTCRSAAPCGFGTSAPPGIHRRDYWVSPIPPGFHVDRCTQSVLAIFCTSVTAWAAKISSSATVTRRRAVRRRRSTRCPSSPTAPPLEPATVDEDAQTRAWERNRIRELCRRQPVAVVGVSMRASAGGVGPGTAALLGHQLTEPDYLQTGFAAISPA